MSYTVISPAQAAERMRSGAFAIDVRTPAEHRALHAAGVRLFPLDRFAPGEVIAARGPAASAPVVVFCQGGTRARTAADQLVAAGCTQVEVVDGGTKAWAAANLPVMRGAATFGLERQVRTIIGVGVLTGALLAVFVHPSWAFLAAFFGAGLTMAGITDWCGLALLIQKMPWNRSAPATGASCAR